MKYLIFFLYFNAGWFFSMFLTSGFAETDKIIVSLLCWIAGILIEIKEKLDATQSN